MIVCVCVRIVVTKLKLLQLEVEVNLGEAQELMGVTVSYCTFTKIVEQVRGGVRR